MKKEEREKRWANGDSYNCYISKELSSFRKDAWKKQICSHFKGRTGLEILDLGTGPGFFACILSEDERVIIRTKLEKPSKIKGLALI